MSLPIPELEQLHYNILDYLTKRSRIMFAYKLSTWNDFIPYYNYQYSDYSREDLRREFLTTILPKVFTYKLTHIQRRKVEIFGTHYHFSQTEEGFHETHSRTQQPVEGVHYVRSETDAKFPNVACILVPSESVFQSPCPDIKTTAWTSAINSTDAELASNCLYRGTRLRRRVTRTKRHFQQTGQLPENMSLAIAKKIIGFRSKVEKLSSICDSSQRRGK